MHRSANTGLVIGISFLYISVLLLRNPNVITGIIGSCLGVSGVQITLWALGIRMELFNTAIATDQDREVRHADNRRIDLEREIDYLKQASRVRS
jgi:multisubunit Na+/H+ antiporter MnhC subunit